MILRIHISLHITLFSEISFTFIVNNGTVKKSFNFQIIKKVFINMAYFIIDFLISILLLKLEFKNPIIIGMITFLFWVFGFY
jgi:hypothetical protein